MRYRVEATGTPPIEITVDPAAGGITLHCGDTTHTLEAGDASGAIVPVLFDGVRRYVGFARMHDGRYQIVLEGRSWVVAVTDPQAAGVDDAHAGSGSINAPIPGMVVEVHVAEGDTVAAGDPLVTLYAMKLENEIRAPFAGSVAELGAAKGTAVEKGELLVRLESE